MTEIGMTSREKKESSRKMNRRKFLAGSIAAGALALGGIFSDKELLAESLEHLGGLRWEITIDGKVVREGNVPVDSKEELTIPVKNGVAHIVMDHGRIYLPEDNNICPKKICSLMGAIMKPGEKITCLPNKLVIRIV